LGSGAYTLHDVPGFVAVAVDSASFLNTVHWMLLHHNELGVARQYRVVENCQTQQYVLLIAKERGEK
jgi:hypothetical protein